MITTNSITQWHELSHELKLGSFRLWQWQYSANEPEGFHAWFCASGQPDIEVVTFNNVVQDIVLEYK